MRVLLVVACWVAAAILGSIALSVSQRRLQRRNAIMGALIVHGPMSIGELASAIDEPIAVVMGAAHSMKLSGTLVLESELGPFGYREVYRVAAL